MLCNESSDPFHVPYQKLFAFMNMMNTLFNLEKMRNMQGDGI